MTAPTATPAAPSFFSPRDSQLVSKYLIGGAAAGGSAALITSLLNYLGAIKEEQAPDSSADDDTLYLNLKKKKGVKRASVAGAAALSGGVLTALGSYALVHHLYQKMKKKELQKQLDAEQQGYLELLDSNKAAAELPAAPEPQGQRMAAPETLLSMPGALAVLLGLASAAVTNKILQKSFPTPKPPGRRGPRRVVIRSDEPSDKMASFEIQDSDELEFLLRLMMSTKSAGLQEFQDIVSAVGQGRHDEVGHGLVNFGVDATASMVKGASSDAISEPRCSMMIGTSALSPVLSPSLGILAAAEFNEHFPSHVKWAAALPEHMQEAFCKIAGVMAIGLRYDALAPLLDPTAEADKSAGMGAFMAFDVLKDALVLNKLSQPQPQQRHRKEPIQDSVNSGGGEDSETTEDEDTDDKAKVVSNDAPSQQFKNEHKDIIDQALAS
jgi:hypothetical protein